MAETTQTQVAGESAASGMQSTVPDYLKNLPVKVDVILGSVQLTVQELLSCGPGSVIDMGKKTTEPFDMYINNRLVARGEVVMIHDRLGLKVVDVIDSTTIEAPPATAAPAT